MKTKQVIAYYPLLVSNIKVAYYAALQYPTLCELGLNWYKNGNVTACSIATRHDVSVSTVCGVISALSVRNNWERNLIDAEVAIKTITNGGTINDFKCCTFLAGKLKAVEIINGTCVDKVLKGNKIFSFYKNLLCPFDVYTVTVDGHAISIALGERIVLDKVPQLTDSQYEIFGNAYRQATAEINADSLERDVLPCQVQSMTWCYWRLIHGVAKY